MDGNNDQRERQDVVSIVARLKQRADANGTTILGHKANDILTLVITGIVALMASPQFITAWGRLTGQQVEQKQLDDLKKQLDDAKKFNDELMKRLPPPPPPAETKRVHLEVEPQAIPVHEADAHDTQVQVDPLSAVIDRVKALEDRVKTLESNARSQAATVSAPGACSSSPQAGIQAVPFRPLRRLLGGCR